MLFCMHCQSPLLLKHQKKFCSRSCSASYNNQFKIKTGKYVKVDKVCSICNTTTTNIKYCSHECYTVSLSSPRKYFTEEDKIRARKMKQREAYARYAAKKKYQTPVDADLSEIKLFYKNCPDGYEVDHKIPISKGGAHSISNLQYLTVSDNRRKSAKLDWSR